MIETMKPLRFLGDSLKALRAFPDEARQDAGFQLDRVQRGEQPDDFKAMPSTRATSREDVALARKRFRDITGRTP